MDNINQSTQGTGISSYRQIVEKYLPAVLVKCTKFTNSKRLAEIIAFYTFTGAYRLTEKLDGSNKIPVVLDTMLNIVGPDYTDGSGKMSRDKLFKRKDKFVAARNLAELDVEECIGCLDGVTNGIDRNIIEQLTESVMKYLKNDNQHLPSEK